MRYFLELCYKGTAYNGWQRQTNAPSVQEALETALSLRLREKIETTGAGRTDTGVHAAYYVAHFDASAGIGDSDEFILRLNSMLPPDVALLTVTQVDGDSHARYDAIRREYKYYIIPYKSPFRREDSWQYYAPLDVDLMNEAASMLLGTRDFTAFSKLHSNNATDTCTVTRADWENKEGELVFTIAADRFLRNMVRSTVGTLVDVGRGKISPAEFGRILESGDRSLASGSAPAQGLFLTDVGYPEEIFKRKTY